MAGEDTTSSVLEAPPLAPLAPSALTAAFGVRKQTHFIRLEYCARKSR